MKNKYYTPDIEDLRVGYELEKVILRLKPKHTSDNETYIEGWEKFIVDEDQMQYICLLIRGASEDNNMLRVPYLTEEQIENEGWAVEEIDPLNPFIKGKKDSKEFLFNRDNYELHLTNQISLNAIKLLYNGECKSINDFRYICKLLKI